MRTPLRITFQNTTPSPALRRMITEQVDHLEQFFGRLTACHVVFKVPDGNVKDVGPDHEPPASISSSNTTHGADARARAADRMAQRADHRHAADHPLGAHAARQTALVIGRVQRCAAGRHERE